MTIRTCSRAVGHRRTRNQRAEKCGRSGGGVKRWE